MEAQKNYSTRAYCVMLVVMETQVDAGGGLISHTPLNYPFVKLQFKGKAEILAVNHVKIHSAFLSDRTSFLNFLGAPLHNDLRL